MDLKELQKAIDDVPDILPSHPTFLQIAGFPHYENVCSNILKFYLNPNNFHGLGDLVIKSILKALLVNEADFPTNNPISVQREVRTLNNGRIDLIIESEHWIVAIENKINHTLNNDLIDYSESVRKFYQKPRELKIVLSIWPEIPNASSGFENLTYERLIKQIEQDLKLMAHENISNDYIIFFNHFILSLKQIFQPIEMNDLQLEFLIKYSEQIEQIRDLDNQFTSVLRRKAYDLINSIKCDDRISKYVHEEGSYIGPYFLYKHNDVEYKLDCGLEKHGVSIVISSGENCIDSEKLMKLEMFRGKDIGEFKRTGKYELERNIDFFQFMKGSPVVLEKLNYYLKGLKVLE